MQGKYISADGVSEIEFIWLDANTKKPKGIVQIAHGMAEHIDRYIPFAKLLNKNGFIVCGNNHIGHGKSICKHFEAVKEKDLLGVLPKKNGSEIIIEDVHLLRNLMQEKFGDDIPYFLFGHSMGSFIIRLYIAKYGGGIAGTIISGTGALPKPAAFAALVLSSFLTAVKGPQYKSKMLTKMVNGGFIKKLSKKTKDIETDFDWLSVNKDNVRTYIRDPLCGFEFSVSGYKMLSELMYQCASSKTIRNTPKEMPLLYISGASDPVGNDGEDIRKLMGKMLGTGHEKVWANIYENMRHEILFEDGKDRVMEDVLIWLEEH
jgi:alpha-beta hydrolase superfamily lysophospholipase